LAPLLRPLAIVLHAGSASAACGRRAEPVVLDGRLLLIPHDPAMLTRHIAGNAPAGDGRRNSRSKTLVSKGG